MRVTVLVITAAFLLAGCSDDNPKPPPGSEAGSEQVLKRDCNDPKWKEQNLGLWYSVCRQPLRW